MRLRRHKVERAVAQQPVVHHVRPPICPHSFGRRQRPVHSHRNGQHAADRRNSGKALPHVVTPHTDSKADPPACCQPCGRTRSWMKVVSASAAISSPSITRSPTNRSGSPFRRARSAASTASCTMRQPTNTQSVLARAICRLCRWWRSCHGWPSDAAPAPMPCRMAMRLLGAGAGAGEGNFWMGRGAGECGLVKAGSVHADRSRHRRRWRTMRGSKNGLRTNRRAKDPAHRPPYPADRLPAGTMRCGAG